MPKKLLFVAIFIIAGLIVLFVWQELQFNDGRLHVVFCDVGQGDGIFIRTPNKTDILIDGGPDRKVLDCLSNHMPFWDKTIELMILSHPHQDHFAGLIDVIESYTVTSFATEELANDSAGFQAFIKILSDNGIEPRYVFAGDRITTLDGVVLTVLGPSKSFLAQTSPLGTIGERNEFGSLILHLSYGQFDVLLTSDSQKTQFGEALEKLYSQDVSLEVFQVPHHGSKHGLSPNISPALARLAVISVGKNNRYGHPHEETFKILREKPASPAGREIRIVRTDQDGKIEIVSDGETWEVR